MVFDAQDQQGKAVYHTNVFMCIGSDFVIAGFEMMTDTKRRDEIIRRFEFAGKKSDPFNLSTNRRILR